MNQHPSLRMNRIKAYIEYVARTVEALGAVVIAIGIVFALVKFFISLRDAEQGPYKQLRDNLGKSILLGPEILVAADTIATVVTTPTMESVLTLGVIVLIRTFLSMSLQIEQERRLPRQSKSPPG